MNRNKRKNMITGSETPMIRQLKENSRFLRNYAIFVAITYLVLIVFINLFFNLDHVHQKTPTAQFELTGNQTVNYTITITEIDFKISLNDTEFYLFDDTGQAVPGEQGPLEWIIFSESNQSAKNANLSFLDVDDDGKFSIGDQFRVKSEENGGLVPPGYSLRIAYYVTGDTICRIYFP